MEIGILALQGAFAEHRKTLSSIPGITTHEIRNAEDLDRPMDGIVIPGGESTAITKLLESLGMWDLLKSKIDAGLPVFGTCAGLIILARKTLDGKKCLDAIDITVSRNAYGRQIDSFFSFGTMSDKQVFPLVFIRAPIIDETGPDVECLCMDKGHIVACRNDRILVTSFHPELTDNPYFHELFVKMCAK